MVLEKSGSRAIKQSKGVELGNQIFKKSRCPKVEEGGKSVATSGLGGKKENERGDGLL